MQKTLLGNRLGRWLTLVFMALLSSSAAWAQSTANYAFTTSSTGSLVDMSTGTTDALATGAYRDDDASTVQNIGFPFVFMGTPYTQFSVNSNGQLRLGTTAISGTVATPTSAPILAAVGGDNAMQATGKVAYKVVAGTNRTLVVEWTGLRIPYASTPGTGTPTQVQVVLEENTGKVEYRYGAFFNNGTSVTRAIFISSGTTAGKIGLVKTFATTPTYDATVTSTTATASVTSLPDNAAVAGLNSTADGSRVVFTFTPTLTPAAPTVALSGTTQLGLSVDITDNSTNEYSFSVYRSTDNVTFAFVGSVATSSTTGTGSTVSLAQTGLTAATQYYYRVVANAEGLPSTAATATVTTLTAVPLCGIKTVGPGATADYPTLTAAFAALTLNGLCGPLVLELQAAYVSTTETFPIAYSYTGTTATNTVTVRPAAGATGLSITGTGATAVFNIVGGKYLILDGRPGGSGSTVSGAATATDLTIASTSTSGIPLQFTSDATFNTVQHCQVKGMGTSDSGSPDINFTGTVTTTGNSDNTVQYCNIGDGATTPVTLVYGGNALNSRNSLLNNNLFNNYGTGSTYGIYLNQSGTGWTITGNSLYQTANRVNVSGTMYGIYVAGGGHTIANNFIGGSAPSAGGTPLTVTTTSASAYAAYRFVGIYLTTSGAATNVQGNTVANISWTSSSGATTTYGILSGIYVSTGDTNIGTTASNLIGTTAGPIAVTTSTTGGYSFGISTASSGTVSIVGNTIANYTGVGSTATIASNVAGILASTGAANTISRNKIYNLAAGSGVANLSTGIWLTGGTLNTVANNLIGDLRAATSTSLVAVSGILVAGGTDNLYYNTISLAATSTGATFGTSGIYLNSTSATLDLRNNIVVNKSTAVGTGGYTAALRRISGTTGTAPANLASTSNNNLYFAGTPSATNLVYVEGTTTATNASQNLADYKTLVATRESLSQTEDVAFLSATGTAATFLHIDPAVPTLAEGKAQPISSITTDFDNDTRNATTPDIGADEGAFITAAAAVDVAATGLVAPSTTGCYGAAESVVVSIRNNGTQALNFAVNPATVTVVVSGAATQTLTATVNTGTLAIGASQNVTVGTLNMSAAGTYTFAVTATAVGDGDASNNNTTATRSKVAIATGPQQLNFTGFTGANLTALYPGWYEATGTTVPSGTTSNWTNDDYANVVNGPNGISAKINLYSNTRNDWMVSPRILATASSVLTYDLALTVFGTTTAGTLGSDDRLEVRVSTDCGFTFTTLKAYTAATPISNTGQSESVSLASYAGQEIIVAFFGTEGTVDDTNDNDVFIDNINLNPQGVDLAPTALVAPLTGQNCYGTAESVTVSIRNSGAQAIDFAVNPATVTVAVTGATTQTLTGTVNTGTLAVGASQNVTVTPLDMSAAGTYTFAITATVAGDQNTANDVLAPAPTRTVTAPVAGTITASSTSLCVSGTVTLTLTGAANGSIQWQQSTDNVTFTDIAGATSATYTTPVLTSTIYFRARVGCNAVVATSAVATITVNNPQITATNSPIAICAGSTATLTATGGAGTSLRFFDVATGGTALATGGTFTTPALTASATYYVEAFAASTISVGPLTNTIGTGLQSSAPQYVIFSVSQATTLVGVNVYPGAAGNLIVEYRSSTGTVLQSATVAITAAQVGVKTFIPLNFNLVPGTAQRLGLGTGSVTAYRNDSGATYPYTGGAVSITGNSFDAAYYYWFYDWAVSNECVGGAARTPIQVNVSQPGTASFPAATASTCGASPYQLAGTVGGSATTGTYTSSGTGTFSPNATTLNATYTPSAADIAAGSVTITLTSAASGACPAATATLALSINAAPVATFSYPATGGNCAGSTGTVAPTLGTGATAGTFTSTTGLTINATTGAVNLATSTAGTYTVTNTVAATGGCAAATATATITVNPTPARPTLTATYNGTTTTLTSSAATGNQFYFNGAAIAGATGQTYVVNGSAATYGSYTVVATNSFGCSSQASVATVVTTARTGIAGASLLVYPNPTPTGQVTLELSGFRSATQLAVIDALGRVVSSATLPATAGVVTHSLDLSGVASGVYMLRLTNADGVETRRLVRE